LGELRIWRKSSGKTQEQLAKELGENPKTYSSYERGASPIPPEILAKLRALGYSGSANQRQGAAASLTREDLEKSLAEMRGYFEARLPAFPGADSRGPSKKSDINKTEITYQCPVILPWHVQEAWMILAEAVDKTGADYRFMDQKALGLLAGLTAEEIARKGFSADTRNRLLARARGFVLASPRSAAR
jgi:transcriptional regulator with XRE-family HTH domain